MGTATVQFDILPDTFIEEAARNMSSMNSESASSILASLAKQHFLHRLDYLIERGHAVRYQQVRGIATDTADHRSLRLLRATPVSIGHFDATLCQERTDERPVLAPILPDNLHVECNGSFFEKNGEWYIDAFHHVGSQAYPYRSQVTRTKLLKTIVKTRFQLNCYYIPTGITELVYARFPSSCPCDESHLMPYITGVWHWIVHFICRICGKTYYCSCFRDAFKHFRKARSRPQLYYADEKLPDVGNSSLFRDGLCHLCRQAPSDLNYCSPMYDNSLEVRYGPYIVKTALVMSKGDPEDEVRLRLGIPAGLRWTSEFELFAMVKEILEDHLVYYQARPEWLGKQSLDIFVPALKLGIEYQGRQHFQPIEYFGGAAGFQNTRMRDETKAALCRQNGITLVYFKYTDNISMSSVKRKLAAVLKAR